jgi:hypothetical protein
MLPVRDISSFKRSFYSVVHSECSASPFQSGNKPRRSQNPTVRQILTEIDCNFQLVGDISSFKRSFYSSLHAGCSVSPFHSGNKPRRSQKPIVRQMLTTIDCDFQLVADISSFKRSFYSSLHAGCSVSPFHSGNKPRRSQKPIVRQILTTIDCDFQLVADISSFKRSFYSSLHAGCSVSPFHSGNKPRRSQNPTVRQILTKIDSNFLPVGDISLFKR